MKSQDGLDLPPFERMLRVGEEHERYVAAWLHSRGWRILGMACKGWRPRNLPELKHADNTYPDMLVERQGEKRWVDVKSKSGTSHYRRGGYDVTGFPLSHWRRYHNIQMRTGTPVWIFFMHRQEGEVRATSISRLESAISHIWADGNMIYFKIAGIPQLASYREIMERRGAEGDIHD